MSDKAYNITVEALRSKSVQYLVIGIVVLTVLYYAKTWFKSEPDDPLSKLEEKLRQKPTP
jgi:hypothetical protein